MVWVFATMAPDLYQFAIRSRMNERLARAHGQQKIGGVDFACVERFFQGDAHLVTLRCADVAGATRRGIFSPKASSSMAARHVESLCST